MFEFIAFKTSYLPVLIKFLKNFSFTLMTNFFLCVDASNIFQLTHSFLNTITKI